MENEYYRRQIKQYVKMTRQASKIKMGFLQHILIVASSILAIILSLHTNNSQVAYLRWVFVVSVVFLLIGTLSMVVALFDYSNLPERARQTYFDEIMDAIKNNTELKEVISIFDRKRTKFFEKSSYSFLVLGLILFVTYNVLMSII